MATPTPKQPVYADPAAFLELVRFDSQGLIPAVIQDAASRQVLTVCYLNEAALRRSLDTGTVHLFRRSQGRVMQKGETSGHLQVIQQILVDCEGRSLVVMVRQQVAACHAGYFSCYFRRLESDGRITTVGQRLFDPTTVYGSSTEPQQ